MIILEIEQLLEILDSYGVFGDSRPLQACPDCNGFGDHDTGYGAPTRCDTCDGQGTVEDSDGLPLSETLASWQSSEDV